MILGAVLAGGRSLRFGSDKALAMHDGDSLLGHAVALLTRQCAAVVVVGREEAPAPTLPDWPAPGMGPLGGIAAALRHAGDMGYTAVLTVSVDAVGLDEPLLDALLPGPSYVEGQPVIGLWPATAMVAVEGILAGDGKHSMRALIEATGARPVRLHRPPANINTPEDLAALSNKNREMSHGL